jgi:hypothetical protein
LALVAGTLTVLAIPWAVAIGTAAWWAAPIAILVIFMPVMYSGMLGVWTTKLLRYAMIRNERAALTVRYWIAAWSYYCFHIAVVSWVIGRPIYLPNQLASGLHQWLHRGDPVFIAMGEVFFAWIMTGIYLVNSNLPRAGFCENCSTWLVRVAEIRPFPVGPDLKRQPELFDKEILRESVEGSRRTGAAELAECPRCGESCTLRLRLDGHSFYGKTTTDHLAVLTLPSDMAAEIEALAMDSEKYFPAASGSARSRFRKLARHAEGTKNTQ